MIKVRLANDDDSEDIYNWRIDKTTMDMSHSNEKPDWVSHCKWFESSLQNRKRVLILCYLTEKEKVGVVRFDLLEHGGVVISINLSPIYRGKGYSKFCLKKSIDYFCFYHPKVKKIYAEIKNVNAISRRSFESVGFHFQYEKNNVGFFIIELKEKLNYIEIQKDSSEHQKITFDLLKKRQSSISHNMMPTFDEHMEFISKHPYRHWFLVRRNQKYLGSIYLHTDNSIGIQLLEGEKDHTPEIIATITNCYQPLPPIKSVRNKNYIINIAKEDQNTADLITKIGGVEIQRTFVLDQNQKYKDTYKAT